MDLIHAIGSFYREGGIGMFPTTLLGLGALALAVRHVVRPSPEREATIRGLTLATVAAGALGAIMGFVATFRFVQHVPVGEQGATTMLGLSESLHNLELALALAVLVLMVGSFGAMRPRRLANLSVPG